MSVQARFVVKDVTDKNDQMNVVLRAKTQAEGVNTENPILFPDAECPEQLIELKFKNNATNRAIFIKLADVLVTFAVP